MPIPSPFRIRPIAPSDSAAVASIIRSVMPEFGAGGAGFAIHDAEVDDMHAAYSRPRCAYHVVEAPDGRVVGGAGVAPLEGGDEGTCELRKMYILPEARGRGIGREMLALCLERAREIGFRRCYLETLEGMAEARTLYERNGFKQLEAPMGRTGHFGCDRWYAREL